MKSSSLKYYILLLLSVNLFLNAQNFQSNKLLSGCKTDLLSSGDIFGTRNFIENKGQFKNPIHASNPVHFTYEHGNEKIFFTSTGLVYEQTERIDLKEEEESKNGEKEHLETPKKSFIEMNWLNCNTSAGIEKSEIQTHYFTYGSADLNALACKKILYRNIYPNIDIEYSLPSSRQSGIKYSFILHPGADLKMIKINYSGDVKSLRQTATGEILIHGKYNDILEQAPISYYEEDGAKLQSSFKLNKNTISFVIDQVLQVNKTLVIDP
ncbi:MAG: hypothetical protein WCR21_06895, partial [Bacteroidota bacterium]